MEKLKYWKLGLAILVLTVALAGCGGGGGGGAAAPVVDRDGDGIPNTADAFPDDATRFINMAQVDLVGIGGTFASAVAINNAVPASAVGSSANNADEFTALRWDVNAALGTAGVPTALSPLLGAAQSAAYAVNDADVVVGDSNSGADVVAVFWAPGSSAAARLPLPVGFGDPSAAYSINNAGQIVGEALVGTASHAVLWNSSATEAVSLGLLTGGTFSAAYFISDAGIVVGEADNASGSWAVAWRVSPAGAVVAGPVVIDPAAGHVASIALGIDAAGRVVGESESAIGLIHAALWTIDTTTLAATTAPSDLGANGSASAINGLLRIAGQMGIPALAKVWDVRNVNLADNVLPATAPAPSQAFGINNVNVVVGTSGSQGYVAFPQ